MLFPFLYETFSSRLCLQETPLSLFFASHPWSRQKSFVCRPCPSRGPSLLVLLYHSLRSRPLYSSFHYEDKGTTGQFRIWVRASCVLEERVHCLTWEIASPGAASKLRSSGSPSTTLAARGHFTLHFLIKTNGQQDSFVSLIVSGLFPNRKWSPCFLELRVLCFTWEIAPPGAASKLLPSGAKNLQVPQARALYHSCPSRNSCASPPSACEL